MPPIRVALLTAALSSSAVLACSSCGCALDTDLGSQGLVSGTGWRVELRYDSVDQDRLRSGSHAVPAPTLPVPYEVEQRTRNLYSTVGIHYGFDRRWGVELLLPFLDRDHATVAAGDAALSRSHSAGLSDARLLFRFTGLEPDMSTGLLFGLKLPTGARDTTFASGPAAGVPLDRSLQLGSGTTDLLLGAYRFGGLGARFGWFSQALYQHALATSAGFATGDSVVVNSGLRYFPDARITPQLQVNLQLRARDADTDPAGRANSGGRLVYLSPGLTVDAGDGWHGHLFVQFPVYQRVNGLQLAPTRVISVGASYAF